MDGDCAGGSNGVLDMNRPGFNGCWYPATASTNKVQLKNPIIIIIRVSVLTVILVVKNRSDDFTGKGHTINAVIPIQIGFRSQIKCII